MVLRCVDGGALMAVGRVMLEQYAHDGDTFACFVLRSTEVLSEVEPMMDLAWTHKDGKTVAEVTQARNALLRLRSLADRYGFADAAAVYYGLYERVCVRIARLMPYR